MHPKFTVSSICERDIDLLLLEELVASAEFGSWLAKRLTPSDLEIDQVIGVARSVTQSTGESDLEVAVALTNGDAHYLLIENKVAAAFQPKQAERYRERGASYVEQGVCAGFTTGLIAPKGYLGVNPATKGFDNHVAYEEIVNWFDGNAPNAPTEHLQTGSFEFRDREI